MVRYQRYRSTFVIFMSCCRIESMAILRLRLCGKDMINFPMAPKHFHLLRCSGWFHAILADIPHLLVWCAWRCWWKSTATTAHAARARGSPKQAAAASIVFSCGSIIWGLINRTGQLLVSDAFSRSSTSLNIPTRVGVHAQAPEEGSAHLAHILTGSE